jgi:hypothetical protein
MLLSFFYLSKEIELSDLGLRSSDLGPRTSDLGLRFSDLGLRTNSSAPLSK